MDDIKRACTLIHVDVGGGSVEDVNWLLGRGYQLLAKDHSSVRSARLAASVSEWVADPKLPERQVGWVTAAPTAYVRAVVRIAVRCRKANGQWNYAVLIAPHTLASLATLMSHQAMPTLCLFWDSTLNCLQ